MECRILVAVALARASKAIYSLLVNFQYVVYIEVPFRPTERQGNEDYVCESYYESGNGCTEVAEGKRVSNKLPIPDLVTFTFRPLRGYSAYNSI